MYIRYLETWTWKPKRTIISLSKIDIHTVYTVGKLFSKKFKISHFQI